MKKRVLSMLLCLVMALALLPTSVFAAGTVPSVTVTVNAPTAGKTPGEVKPTLSTEAVTLYDYDWKDENGNTLSKSFNTFESGKSYRLIILATTAAKQFASGTTATVNGQTATVDDRTDTTLRFYYDFTLDTTIDTVNLNVAPFYLGNTPQDISVTAAEGQHFSIQSVEITDADDNPLAGNHKFADRERVYVYVKLQANVGYTFPSDYKDLNSYFDGEEGQEWPYTDGKNAVTVYMAYRVGAATTIDRIDATITEPVTGAKPSFTATLDPSTLIISNRQMGSSEYTENGVGWLDQTTGKYLKPGDTFQADHSYQFSIGWLSPASGSKLAADGSGNVAATATVNGSSASITGSATNFIVTYTFPALAAETKEIKILSVSLAAPKAGEKASFAASVPSDADYTVKSVDWFCDEDNASLKNGDAYGKKTYILNVTLSPKSGYKFADETVLKGTLNGESAQARRLDDGSALVTKYFSLGNPNPFTDVKEGDYFYDAVQWAYYVEPQVTNGVGNNAFGPDSTVTRGQAMTFLWRAAGCPEPKTTKNPFTDVKESDYWYKAILWAAETGVSNGTGDNKYSPNMHCSRAHIVTFLYRAAGEPNKTGAGAWYDDAANWANSIGLLSGTAKAFTPEADCPRKDIVLYLYRQLAK